jgi:hypothetical protein
MAVQPVEGLAHAIAGQVLADLNREAVTLELVGNASRIIDRFLQWRIGVRILGVADDEGKPLGGDRSRRENRGERKDQQSQQGKADTHSALELPFRSSQAIRGTPDANFGIKGALAACQFQCGFEFEVPKTPRRNVYRNFKFAALAQRIFSSIQGVSDNAPGSRRANFISRKSYYQTALGNDGQRLQSRQIAARHVVLGDIATSLSASPWRGLAWRKKAPLSRRHIAVGAQILAGGS